MPNYFGLDSAACNSAAWGAGSLQPSMEEEAAADVDEPPDPFARRTSDTQIHYSFQKTVVVPRSSEHVQSLLTKALQSQSEDEAVDSSAASNGPRRRRSITSNISAASTTDFTSDTGITTPARTSSPSPSRLLIRGGAPVEARRKIAFATPPTDALDATPKPPVQKPATPAPAETQPRKRCISFACADVRPFCKLNPAGPNAATHTKAAAPPASLAAASTSGNATTSDAASAKPAEPRRPCIKFACPVRPSTDCHKPHTSNLKVDAAEARKMPRKPSPAPVAEPRSPVYRKHNRGPSSGRSPRPPSRPGMARRTSSRSAVPTRSKKYISAQPEDLAGESSRFHEFASDSIVDDDWIRHATASIGHKITINDTLKKELAIRLLAKEAEEEAALEDGEEDDETGNVSGNEDGEEDGEEEEEDDEEDEEEEDEDEDEEDDDDDDEEDFDEEDEEDENDTVEDRGRSLEMDLFSSYKFDAASDGYNTDNEVGFASSDDEDDGLVLWTVKQNQNRRREEYQDIGHSTLYQGGSPVFRRLSMDEQSDSSAYVEGQAIRQDKPKNRELNGRRPATPELPDSTDFVCGTFDEDRPLEEAYLSHMAARKREKYRTIPQDIDPSFPTSDPEESDNDEKYKKKAHPQKQQHGSADDHLWQLDDLHHGQDQADMRRKKDRSPRRCRSPPPPKLRGRSPAPRHLFERHSPNRRMKSPAPRFAVAPAPAPQAMPVSPRASPVEIATITDTIAHQALAFRPGLTQTKSLPRPPAIFRHQPPHTQNHHHGPGKAARRQKTHGMASTKPMHIRGALDIVKGLEQKRQRRREKFQQKYCNRARKGQAPERRPQRGEGAERMRELGLLMAGKHAQGSYVISI